MKLDEVHAVVDRDEDGYRFVDFPDVPGCHTQGRTLRKARERMRNALALFVDNADTVRSIEHLKVSEATQKLIDESRWLRQEVAEKQRMAQEATKDAAVALLALGWSLRDSAEALGLSFQRVQQIASPSRERQQSAAAHK